MTQNKPQLALFFTYGTLKRGGRLHTYLEDFSFLREDTIGNYKLYACNYQNSFPMAVPCAGTQVHGEVFVLPVWAFRTLDRVEQGYRRQTITLHKGGKAEVYVWPHSAKGLFELKGSPTSWTNQLNVSHRVA